MLSAKKEVKEQDQGSPHSGEAKSCIEEGFIEPPIQEAFDEKNIPTITQQPCLDIQGVMATNKKTEEKIVTKLPLNISRKKERSTTSNPTP
ncbi:hypothetical protein AHAS_Ahas12G0109700 [Arachis hypogaea]